MTSNGSESATSVVPILLHPALNRGHEAGRVLARPRPTVADGAALRDQGGRDEVTLLFYHLVT